MCCSRFVLLTGFVLFAGCANAPAPMAPAQTVTSSSLARSQVDAKTALSAARPGLRACRRNHGATPVVFDATLEFEPSGKVSRVLIAPGGPVADCVRSDLTQVEIPRFDGAPVEVEMQITL